MNDKCTCGATIEYQSVKKFIDEKIIFIKKDNAERAYLMTEGERIHTQGQMDLMEELCVYMITK